MKEIVLENLQNVLPIGYYTADGTRQRHFTVKPWKMAEEKAIGKLLEGPAPTMDKFIPECLALMVPKLGTMNLSDIPHSEKLMIFHRMYYSDVMYMYIWLRREALGSDLGITVACPFCSTEGKFFGDLNTLTVKVAEDEVENQDELNVTVELRDGLEIGEKVFHEVVIKPPTWMAMDSLTARTVRNEGEMKRSIFQNCVDSVPGYDIEHFVLTEDHMDNMTKFDMEKLSKEINEIMGGAQLFIEVKCDNCAREFAASVQWDYDRFFSHLSMPSL